MKSSRAPAEHKGGKYPVEIELGPEQTYNAQPAKSPGLPEHKQSRFGSNLVTNETMAGLAPVGKQSAGTPVWQATRFGKADVTDGTPAYTPGKK